MRWIVRALGLLLLLALAGGALYAWRGAWPRSLREWQAYRSSLEERAGARPEPLIGNVGEREGRSLAGTWQALVDPNRWGRGPLLGDQLPRHRRAAGPAELVEYSFEDGLTLEVPGDWNTQREALFFYREAVWYQRDFDWEPRPGTRSFLHFGAANYRAEVFLNGRRLGSHEGGHTPFVFEVSERVRPGSNDLVVLVDAEKGERDVPARAKDWLDYGGLTRDVRILRVPETFVRSWRIQLAPEDPGRITGWVQLDGPRSQGPVTVSIPELGLRATLEADAQGRASLDLAARPELWSPRSPKLYRVLLEAAGDRVGDSIGFRTVAVRDREILLNGEPIYLRGISLHGEAPFGGGRAQGDEDAETLLGWVAELGANFARLAHYPHDEAMLRAADRLGILVWAEIPVYWDIAFGDPHTLRRARQQLSELIARDANRASVILWSIGNETPIHDERNAFMAALAEHVRSLDDSRLVTAALLSGLDSIQPLALRALRSAAGLDFGDWRFPVVDPLGEQLDVVGVNEYIGWYYATPIAERTPFSSETLRRILVEGLPEVRIETGHDKPVVISEFGAGARAGFHAPEQQLAVFSEEYQALLYRQQLAMISGQPGVVGLSPRVQKVLRSPHRGYKGGQDKRDLEGVVSDRGERKLAFGVLREHYRGLAEREGR